MFTKCFSNLLFVFIYFSGIQIFAIVSDVLNIDSYNPGYNLFVIATVTVVFKLRHLQKRRSISVKTSDILISATCRYVGL